MSRILFLALLLFAVATAQAQTEKRIYTQSERESMSPNGQKERERRKQLEAMEDSLNFVRAVEAIEKLDFVLEANRLTFKRGQSVFVNSTTNRAGCPVLRWRRAEWCGRHHFGWPGIQHHPADRQEG